MLALHPRVVDAVWQAVEGLLPPRPADHHPLGCHRSRSADRVCFTGILYRLVQRRARIAAEIAALGPALPGSLVQRHNRCARPDCACKADPPQLHSPYPAWTRKVNGKTVTRSLNPEQAARYQVWVDNNRRLRELVTELQRLAIEQAEATEGWPRS